MKKINILSIVAFGFVSGLNAQAFFEFNNRHLSQSQLWNPGFMPQYKATLSVGQTYFGAQFVGATLNGLFGKEETPLQTVNRMVGENEKQLGIDLFHQSDLFHFGFRSKKSYFAINSTLVNEASVRMPKDLIGLAFLGNGGFIQNDANIDFSGNQLRSYVKNTFTYGRFLTNELSVGVNASLLNGITDFSMDQARFGIGTDTGTASIYSLRMQGAVSGKASLLGLNVDQALNDSNYDAQQSITDQLSQIQIGTNQGYAFGFGAVYRLNEKWRFSLAVQNLGSIVWNLGAQDLKMNASEWVWNGLDTSQTANLSDEIGQQLQDTFLSKFDLQGSTIPSYTTKLNPRYTLGVEFLLRPRTHIQAFGGYGFGMSGDKIFVSTTLHQELGEWVDLRVGYSLFDIDNPSHRLGLGLSLNLGPLQIFGSVNDVLGIVNYGTATATSGMFGVNINIGTRKDRDYDEVPDKRDSCFKTFGVISNDGCPYGFLGGSMNYDETEEEVIQETEQGPEENLPEPTISNAEELEPVEPVEPLFKNTPSKAPESKPIEKTEPVDSDSKSAMVAETASTETESKPSQEIAAAKTETRKKSKGKKEKVDNLGNTADNAITDSIAVASAPMESDSLKIFTDVEIQALKETGVLFDTAVVDLSKDSRPNDSKSSPKKVGKAEKESEVAPIIKEVTPIIQEVAPIKKKKSKANKSKDLEDLMNR